MFKQLELEVKADVDTIRGLDGDVAQNTGGSPTKTIEAVSSGRRFSVTRSDRGSRTLRSVSFTLEAAAVLIQSDYDEGHSFSATIHLNRDGHCLWLVDDIEMESWQVRRKALQELFFGGPHQQLVTVSARRRT